MTNQKDCPMFTLGRSLSASPKISASPAGASASKNKYQRWYDAICARARSRSAPTCYTEVHHIKPRSLGGSDDKSNLVRLSYREHYAAHHLLIKIHTGENLRKMQKAFWAMSLKSSGERIVAPWQVEQAKRLIRDMELDDDAREAWYKRRRDKKNAELLARKEEAKRQEAQNWASAIESAKMFSPEILADVLTRKAKRDADIKIYGWHYSRSVPGPKTFETF